MQARQARRVDAICGRFVLKIVARGRDAVEWRPKRGQNRSFCEVKKLINFIPILHARYEGSSDRGGALKPPPMGLGSYWALVDTKKTRFGRCLKKSISGHLAIWLPLARAPRLTRLTFLEKSVPRSNPNFLVLPNHTILFA